jgi:cell shape-determining protein MreC
MTSTLKGGRGKVAPYTSTHCRIPEPIKSTVQSLAAAYRSLIEADDLNACENLLKSTNEAISNLGEVEQEINQLKADLAAANNRVELLKAERENMINTLKPTLEMKSRDGVKMKELIREAFPELIDPSISKQK